MLAQEYLLRQNFPDHFIHYYSSSLPALFFFLALIPIGQIMHLFICFFIYLLPNSEYKLHGDWDVVLLIVTSPTLVYNNTW